MEFAFTVYEFTDLDIAIADLQSCIAAKPFLNTAIEGCLFNEDGSMKEGLLNLRARDEGGAFGIAIEVSDRLKEIVSAFRVLAGLPDKLPGVKGLNKADSIKAASDCATRIAEDAKGFCRYS